MYRFLVSPRWLGFHLLVLTAVIVMITLSLWQLDRLHDRREFNAAVVARVDLPAASVEDLLTGIDLISDPALSDFEWRPVVARGIYRPEHEVQIVNRSQNGRAGRNVVTPLELPTGEMLLVSRGFVPLGFETPPAPEGVVAVRGLLRVSQQRRTGQLSDPAEGVLIELQRLDITRIAAQVTGRLMPMSLQLLESVPPEAPGTVEPVIRPDLSEGSHLSYAVQWAIFATAVVVGWALAVQRSLRVRRVSGSRDAESVDPPSSDVPASTTGRP